MKDCALRIHKTYYDRLLSGLEWEVFDRVPPDATLPYVVIANIQTADDSTKTEYGQQVIVTVEAWQAYTGDAGGKKEVEEMGDAVAQIVCDWQSRMECDSEFHIITTLLESAETVEEGQGQPKNLIRRVLRFRHKVEQLQES